jgi:hypothetical protein
MAEIQAVTMAAGNGPRSRSYGQSASFSRWMKDGVCHDPTFYQILEENFRFYFACVD